MYSKIRNCPAEISEAATKELASNEGMTPGGGIPNLNDVEVTSKEPTIVRSNIEIMVVNKVVSNEVITTNNTTDVNM